MNSPTSNSPPSNTPGVPPVAGASALSRAVTFARLSLFWETFWPGLAPALGWTGLFLILALFNIPQALPAVLHSMLLAAWLGGLAWLLYRGLRGLALPDRASALKRIEDDSKLAHHPLAALEDSLAAGLENPATLALWQAHLARARASLGALRLKAPAAGFGRIDHFGVRAGILLTLLLAGLSAGADAPERLKAALDPGGWGWPADPPRFDAWITPPAYTGVAPVVLARSPTGKTAANSADANTPAAITVPVGSVLQARLHGGRETPSIILDDQKIAFEKVGDESYQINLNLTPNLTGSSEPGGSDLGIRQGRTMLAEWPLTVEPDRPPEINLLNPPTVSARGAVEIEFNARDDFGLSRVYAEITQADDAETLPLDLAASQPGDLAASQPGLREAADRGFLDLTSHPWAGEKVLLHLVAEDAIDQRGQTPDTEFVLPERQFHHPVAKALAEERKRLRAQPHIRGPALELLAVLAQMPEQWGSDVVVSLALGLAHARLERDWSPGAVKSVVALMWQTALRIEDGQLGQAEKRLRAAQDDLMAALARHAPDSEIAELVAALQLAMEEFLASLKDQARQRAAQGEPVLPLAPGERAVGEDQLREMLERAHRLLQAGDREAARQLLQSLRQMMENIAQARVNPNAANAAQQLGELSRLTERQRELLERSRARASDSKNAALARQDAASQAELRARLDQIMQALGDGAAAGDDAAEALESAASAMGEAGARLRQGRSNAAIPPQAQALEALEKGVEAVDQHLREQSNLRQPGEGSDPFGRPGGGWDRGQDTKVPTEAEINQARKIQDELHRRMSEPDRPTPERDYLERLLRRF